MITAILTHNMLQTLKNLLFISGLLAFSLPCMARGLFDDHSILEVTMTGPLNSLFRHKEDEQAFPFVLSVEGQEVQAMASVRGNSRKKVCRFPPIKLGFDQPGAEDNIFAGHKSLKLVTHCNRSTRAQDNLIEEFIAYRMFNLLSDASYRVRLLHINYVDTENGQSTRKLAFIIEPNGSLAKRNDAEPARVPAVSLTQMNQRQLALVYVFQYLIGNTDWSLVSASDDEDCCHNGKLISKNDELLYVPYDFDLSGLVDAHYAFPDPSIGIRKVSQRRYRGFCMDRATLATALQDVKSHQAAYNGIIDSLTPLSASAKKRDFRYLDRFFTEAGDEQKMLEDFEKHCLD